MMKRSGVNDIVIIGAGGVGRYVCQALKDINDEKKSWNLLGFIDEDETKIGREVDGFPVLGDLSWLTNHTGIHVSLAISYPQTKWKIVHILKKENSIRFATLIHPDSWIADSVHIGEGALVYPGVTINVNASIGDFVTINMRTAVGHDVQLEEFVTLAPNVGIGGNSVIGRGTSIGIGTVTIQNIKIGAWSVVGAASNVISNIPENLRVAGNPARPLISKDSVNPPDGVFILGGGGHAKVVISTMISNGYRVCGIYDDNVNSIDRALLTYQYCGPISNVMHEREPNCILAIGDNVIRRNWSKKITGIVWQSAIHPDSYVHSSVNVGKGTVVFAGAVIQPGVTIGDHCIINTGATVDHDCTIGDYVHIAPGAHLGGNVHIGEGSFVGISSTIIPNITVGTWSVIGAGAAVIRDIPSNVTAVGVPARVRKDN